MSDLNGGKEPLVSVCIPAYNAGRFLGKCLASVLGQSYGRIEVIVSDNSSTDDTADIVRRMADARVRYARNPENIGAFPNWNRAVDLARGEFVAVYHADDIYERDIVREEVGFLRENPQAGAVFAGALRIDEEDRVIGDLWLPGLLRGGVVLSFPEALRAVMEHGNFLVCPTFMARREVLFRAGRFRDDLFGTASDTGMWFAILAHASIGVIDRPLMRYRVGKWQGTWHIEHLRTTPADHFKVIDHYLAHPLAAGAVPPAVAGIYETSRLFDEMHCLRNLIMQGRIPEARALSRRIYTVDAFRKYLYNRRRMRCLKKRLFYSLLLEAGLGKITGKVMSHGNSVH